MFEVLTLECNLQNVGIFRVVRYLVGCKILENLFFGSPSEKFDNPCSNSLKVLQRFSKWGGIYSQTGLQQRARDRPNLFIITMVRYNRVVCVYNDQLGLEYVFVITEYLL